MQFVNHRNFFHAMRLHQEKGGVPPVAADGDVRRGGAPSGRPVGRADRLYPGRRAAPVVAGTRRFISKFQRQIS